MATKYARQLKRARASIARKGTTCTWYKPGAADGADTTPEFPELADAQDYPGIPIVLYPQNRQNEQTVSYNVTFGAGETKLYGLIPGDVGFTPEENDAVVINGSLTHVDFVNTTQPDGTPIVYEVGFK